MHLLEAVDEITSSQHLQLSVQHLSTLFQACLHVHSTMKQLLGQETERVRLQQQGLLDLFIKIEVQSISCYLSILCKMTVDKNQVQTAEGPLIQ
jgi:hypothetical protein